MGTQWVGPLLVKWLLFMIRHFKYPARYFLLQAPGISDLSLNFPHQGWGNDGSRGWSMCFARRSPGFGSDNPAHHKYHDIKYHPPLSLHALVLTSLEASLSRFGAGHIQSSVSSSWVDPPVSFLVQSQLGTSPEGLVGAVEHVLKD